MTVDEVLEQKGREVHSVDGTASLEDAALALQRANIGCVAVSLAGRISGVVGEREIARAIAQAGTQALSVEVQKVMARLCVCQPGDDLAGISRRMTTERVRHILVIDEGEVVGVISIGDVLKRRLRECQLEVGVLRDYARTRVVSH